MKEIKQFNSYLNLITEGGYIPGQPNFADQIKIPPNSQQPPPVVDYDSASKKYYAQREKKLGKTGSDLMSLSQGQFGSKADRLDQAKVDSVLGAGKYQAGSKEANLALLQHFKQNPAVPGQGAKPSVPAPQPAAPVTAAVKGAENLTPYSKAADVAGLTGLAATAGQFLPKIGGTIAKAVPGLNVAYQGADALRRASLGDYAGSAISAAGAVPVLGLPAVAVQAARDKYRTGSFFPSDQELKTAVDKDKGVAATPDAPKLKEGNKPMDRKQKLKHKIKRLEEDKAQLIKTLEDKFGAGLAALRQMRGYGNEVSNIVKRTRTGDIDLPKVFGRQPVGPVDSMGNPLKDIKYNQAKDPAVWRRGERGVVPKATPAAPKAEPVAPKATVTTEPVPKTGGKPLSRAATAAAAAVGGGLIGYGLADKDDGQGPKPTVDPTPGPVPTPGPGPRPGPSPSPNKPAEDDPYDLQPVKPSARPGPGSEQWLRSELEKNKKPEVPTSTKTSTSAEPSQADIDAATKANAANAERVAADVKSKLDAEKARADFAKSAAANGAPTDVARGSSASADGGAAMPKSSSNSDEKYPLRDKGLFGGEIKYRQDADGRKYTDPNPVLSNTPYRQPETRYYSGDDVKGWFKEDKKTSKQNTVSESINTELNDILWLAGRLKR